MLYWDLRTGEWKGPVEVKLTGRGYVCVLTDEGPKWVPSQWVKLETRKVISDSLFHHFCF